MSKTSRNSSPDAILSGNRTFFVTFETSMRRRLLQGARSAMLFVDVLRTSAKKEFMIHDFVVMPDHVHLLLTLDQNMSVEKAVQLVKGRYSYRRQRELGHTGEGWQRGFSEVRVEDRANFLAHREYIAMNPVRARLANAPDESPYCFNSLARAKREALRAMSRG